MFTHGDSSDALGSIDEQQNSTIARFVHDYSSRYELGDNGRKKTKASSSLYVPALTGVRGIAALLVVFSHYSGSGPTLGQIGVQIFFVLSAYLMCFLYLGRPERKPLQFLRNRAIRVLPLLVLVATGAKCCSWYPNLERYDILKAQEPLWKYVVMMKGASIEWTIAMEFGFYLFFAMVLTLPAMLSEIALGTCTAAGMLGFIIIRTGKWFENVTGIHWGILTEKAYVYKWFMVGIFAWNIERFLAAKKILYPRNKREIYDRVVFESIFSFIFAGGFLIRCVYWHLLPQRIYNHWDSSIDAFGMVVLILGSKHFWPLRYALSSKFLQHMGNISYSLYLTHMFVFHFLDSKGLRDPFNPFLVLVFFTACILVASSSYFLFEKPVNQGLRRAFTRRKQQKEVLPSAFAPENNS